MKYLAAVGMIAVFVGSAQAQEKMTPLQIIDAGKQAEQADVERRYNEQMKRQKSQPAPEAKPDPWGAIRTVTPPPRDKR